MHYSPIECHGIRLESKEKPPVKAECYAEIPKKGFNGVIWERSGGTYSVVPLGQNRPPANLAVSFQENSFPGVSTAHPKSHSGQRTCVLHTSSIASWVTTIGCHSS